jgi:hypothetical protein
MTYIYDNIQEIRVAEFMLLDLAEAKLILAQVDSPTQARTMAATHSIEAEFWVDEVIHECNKIHKGL